MKAKLKKTVRVSGILAALCLVTLSDIPPVIMDSVPDAHAILGVRRRAVRRGVIIGSAAAHNADAAAAAAVQQPVAQQPVAQQPVAQQPVAQQPATRPSSGTSKPVAQGTVVHSLPGKCSSSSIKGVEYYNCGGTYYRAAFNGNNLVYVATDPQ